MAWGSSEATQVRKPPQQRQPHQAGSSCCVGGGEAHAGRRRGLSARADLAAADARGPRAPETLAPPRQ